MLQGCAAAFHAENAAIRGVGCTGTALREQAHLAPVFARAAARCALCATARLRHALQRAACVWWALCTNIPAEASCLCQKRRSARTLTCGAPRAHGDGGPALRRRVVPCAARRGAALSSLAWQWCSGDDEGVAEEFVSGADGARRSWGGRADARGRGGAAGAREQWRGGGSGRARQRGATARKGPRRRMHTQGR